MSTLGANNLTIADAVRRMTSDGEIRAIGEILNQRNGIIADIPWREGDEVGGHMVTQRTSLPTIQTVIPGNGVQSSASSTDQFLEAPEILGGFSVIDQYVANYGGNPESKRASEDVAFIEKFDQTIADRWIYGNSTTTPGQVDGLATRYGAIASSVNYNNIIDCGGTGSVNMSMWLLGFGPKTLYGWYPKGSPAGLYRKDWGAQVRTNSDGTEQVVYRTEYSWAMGVALEDWRFASRMCNIDQSLLILGTGADLFTKAIQAIHAIFDINMCRPGFYINRTTRAMLDIQARNDVMAGGQLRYEMVDGKRIEFIQNIPVNLLDRLTQTESRVT